jgi:hypothetical protein
MHTHLILFRIVMLLIGVPLGRARVHSGQMREARVLPSTRRRSGTGKIASMFADVTNEKYAAYLSSEQWKAIRAARIRKDRSRCQGCGIREDLHVHHRTYERFTRERISDLITLCESCHALVHDTHRRMQSSSSLDEITAKVVRLLSATAVYKKKQAALERQARERTIREAHEMKRTAKLERRKGKPVPQFIRVCDKANGWHDELNPAWVAKHSGDVPV